MLWVVGQVFAGPLLSQWAFQGVFDSEEAAIAACRDAHYFIAPAVLNASRPHENEQWDGAYFPRDPNETRGRGYQGEIKEQTYGRRKGSRRVS